MSGYVPLGAPLQGPGAPLAGPPGAPWSLAASSLLPGARASRLPGWLAWLRLGWLLGFWLDLAWFRLSASGFLTMILLGFGLIWLDFGLAWAWLRLDFGLDFALSLSFTIFF